MLVYIALRFPFYQVKGGVWVFIAWATLSHKNFNFMEGGLSVLLLDVPVPSNIGNLPAVLLATCVFMRFTVKTTMEITGARLESFVVSHLQLKKLILKQICFLSHCL